MRNILLPLCIGLCFLPMACNECPAAEDGFIPLFDGKTFDGWEGNQKIFRIEDGAIVGGRLDGPIKHNEFLTSKNEYDNFELRLKFKLFGDRRTPVFKSAAAACRITTR